MPVVYEVTPVEESGYGDAWYTTKAEAIKVAREIARNDHESATVRRILIDGNLSRELACALLNHERFAAAAEIVVRIPASPVGLE